MIELRDVTVRAGKFLLQNVSLEIPTGQYAVLMGRTGRGKTTLLESICGLKKVVSGSVWIHGTDVTAWSPSDRGIGYVPQDLALFPTLTVHEHFAFALRLRKHSADQIKLRVDELAKLLGVSHLLGRHVKHLSGGESQRVALGRALSFRPAVLLLDEPLSALDEATRHEMHSLLRQVQKASQVTMLHITHNSAEADALADCRYMLEDGKIHPTATGSSSH
jgi:ABC-type sugar transport system ATPase subunit